MRNYDGSMAWEMIERRLQKDGYVVSFSCASFSRTPPDLEYTGRENGWEMRRMLTAWCSKHGISDYRIVRNTSYLKDLHGPRVYELWIRKPGTQ